MSILKKEASILRGERLAQIRNMLNMKQKEFCDLCNISKSALGYWESGDVNALTKRSAIRIIKALNETNLEVDIDWLLEGEPNGHPPVFKQKKISLSENHFISEQIKIFNDTFKDEAIIYHVIDDSMEPICSRDDYVGAKKYYPNNLNEFINKVCIIEINDNTFLLRKIKKSSYLKRFNLFSLNSESEIEFPTMLNVEIISAAPILVVWKNFDNITRPYKN